MNQHYAAWLRGQMEAATPATRYLNILPHVEELARVCRREISTADTVSAQYLYHRMLRDFEDLIQQYAAAA